MGEEFKKKAAAKDGSAEEIFAAMDKRKPKGKINAKEVMRYLKKLGMSTKAAEEILKAMDSDGDGVVSEEEFSAALGGGEAPSEKSEVFAFMKIIKEKYKSPQEAFEEFDLKKRGGKKDGKLTKKEFIKAAVKNGMSKEDAEKLFKKLDKDKDGIISEEEFFKLTGGCKDCSDEFVDEIYAEFSEKVQKKNKSPKEAFEEIDVSEKDGKITIEEFVEYAKKLKLSKEEAEEIYKKYIDKGGTGKSSRRRILYQAWWW